MKAIKFTLILFLSLFFFNSYSQSGGGGSSTTTSVPYYSGQESNYSIFAQQNFNYLKQDTSYAGRKKLKYFGREYYFWKTRLGNNDTPGNTKDYSRAINSLRNYPCSVLDSANWNCEGPFTNSQHTMGLISAVYMNPANQNEILIGSNTSGIWRTSDRGVNWTNLTSHIKIPSLTIENFSVNPFDSNEILASGGHQTTSVNKLNYGPVLLKSIDGGLTWNEFSLDQTQFKISDQQIVKVSYSPNVQNEIYLLQTGKFGGLYKSRNNGSSFSKIFDMTMDTTTFPLQEQNGLDFEIFKNGTIIIASGRYYSSNPQSFISRDTGNTWIDLLNNTPNPDFVTHVKNKTIDYVILSKVYDSLIYVAVKIMFDSDGYIFKSIDGGNTFYLFGTVSLNGLTGGMHDIEPSLINNNGVHMGGKNYYFYDSVAGGRTYNTSSSFNSNYHVDYRDIQVLLDTNGDELVINGNDGGVSQFNFTNSTASLVSLNGNSLPITQFYRLGISQYGDGFKIIAGCQDNGSYILNNVTNNWFRTGVSDGAFSWVKYDGTKTVMDNLYSVTYHKSSNFYPSSIDMVRTSLAYSSIDGYSIDSPLKVMKNGKITYYHSNPSTQLGKNLNLSLYTGNTRQNIDSIAGLGVISADEYVEDFIWIAHDDPAIGGTNKLYKSDNGGNSFTDITLRPIFSDSIGTQISTPIHKFLGHKTITSIEINPKDNKEMWMSISGVYDAQQEKWHKEDTNKHLIRVVHSLDSGNTWYDWSQGLPKPRIPVNNLVYHQQSNGLVFCATDMGVYYRNNTTNEWRCFQTGLPPIIVTDLKINYCEGKIYCSTFGRGIYSSDIPNSLLDNSLSIGAREITTQVLIDYTMFTPYDIRIKSGGILRVTDTLIFATGRKIIVEPGGKLIMNGGALTSRCGDTWDGIYAMGLAGTDQIPPNQGTVYLNNSLIENAKIGFRASNPYSSGGHGGIIKAGNTTFLNNEKDIEFLSYHNTYVTAGIEVPNRSEFNSCKFIIDDNILNSSPDARISMYDVNGVEIFGCEFEDKRNSMTNMSGASRNSNAINSIDATFIMDEHCTSTGTPCTSTKRSSIKNFYKGVYAMGSVPNKSTTIKKSDFINNGRGIVLEGTSGTRVLNNSFTTDFKHSSGVYLMSSTGYQVEGNNFVTSGIGGQNYTTGVVIYNKHGNDEEIYRNKFDNQREAVEALGQNKEFDNTKNAEFGLVIKCNEFNNNSTEDMYIRDDPAATFSPVFLGINRYQGVAGGGTDELAGNLFSNTNSTNFWVNNSAEYFNYFHHNEVITPRVRPSNWTVTTANMVSNIGVSFSSSSCPDWTIDSVITLGGLISLISTNKNLETQNISTLQGLIDGGNTPLLVSEVTSTNNTSAYQHYLDLMAESGYLSEEVLEEVANQENGFTLAMIRDILVANSHSASSEEIQQILDDRITELPPFMRIQILAGLNQVSPLEYMKRVISKYSTLKNGAINQALHILRADSNSTIEDFEAILINTNNLYYDLQLVDLYTLFNQSGMADQLLLEMEEKANNTEGFHDYFNDFKNLRVTINGWENQDFLNLEENQLEDLEEYADKSNPTSAKARKLLVLNNQTIAPRPIYFSDEEESEPKKQRSFKIGGLEQSEFSIFPNPTKNFVTLSYTIIETGENKQFVLVNSIGKMVKNQQLQNSQDQVVIKLDNLAPGEYIGFVLVDGKSIGSKKLNVIK